MDSSGNLYPVDEVPDGVETMLVTREVSEMPRRARRAYYSARRGGKTHDHALMIATEKIEDGRT